MDAKTEEADIIIEALHLNRLEYQSMRQLWLHIVRRSLRDADLIDEIFGFPQDLPDLSKPRPPEGNARPLGITQSYFAQRERGTLPKRNY